MSYSAQLNNLGVAALEDSKYDVASEYLRQALNAKRSNVGGTSSSSHNTFSTNITRIEREAHRVHADSTIPVLTSTEERIYHQGFLSASTISCSSGAFLYRKGFMIYPSEHPGEGDDAPGGSTPENYKHAYTACAIEMAFLLFNMGLVCHLRGEQTGSPDASQVKKAITLYKMALGLVENVLDSGDCRFIHFRLVVAILNNLGTIYYEHEHYYFSEKYFLGLSEILIYMSIREVDRTIDRDDWNGLTLNAMTFSDHKVAPAA